MAQLKSLKRRWTKNQLARRAARMAKKTQTREFYHKWEREDHAKRMLIRAAKERKRIHV